MTARWFRAIAAIAVTMSVSGCSTLSYYSQAIGGEVRLLQRRTPISRILENPSTPARLRTYLEDVAQIRKFAVRQLGLPDNGSYRDYVHLNRKYVVWVVYAAPGLSLRPRQWCFPFAGCVAYRGYFARADALKYATRLRRRGYDTYVAGVTAYSTLGWLRDPVLSTMLRHGETAIAETLFHELAHQKLYIRGDTTFDESFAVTVSRAGMRRWLNARGNATEWHRYLEQRRRHSQVMALLLRYRARLEALYASTIPAGRKLQDKQRVLASLRAAWVRLYRQWGIRDPDIQAALRRINNAYFVPIGLYDCDVAAFRTLLASVGGNLPVFYAKAREIGALPAQQRHRALAALAPRTHGFCAGRGQ
ncbi:MAG: aminopeptidase [Pseudomonadota bacterium]|nr:aminopeptidase [Pseudomonadota bacterium]